ncbi:MAG TPA: glycosyltransferase family 9 protein, partial [Chloroflexota bacterium]|nr:glycosyltransferase family 9 protein [Chloroflexota bacterium]
MTPQRILFVELLGGIGDLIFAIPSLAALHAAYPRAWLDVFTFAPGAELLVGDPRIHQVFFARRATGQEAEPPCRNDLRAVLALGHYDLVISDTRHSGIHGLIEESGVPRTVTQLWSGAKTDELISSLFLRRLCEERVIVPTLTDHPARVFLGQSERDFAAAYWQELGLDPSRTVALNPHSGVTVKRWPSTHFVRLGQGIVDEGWQVVVLAADAPALAKEIAEQIPSARVLEKLPLRQTAAWLERLALLISGDSGIAHLASAVGTSVVAIYGPTWAGRYGVAGMAINLQSPFACSELNPMNFTTQWCWYSGRCIHPGKLNCCEDVTPETAL